MIVILGEKILTSSWHGAFSVGEMLSCVCAVIEGLGDTINASSWGLSCILDPNTGILLHFLLHILLLLLSSLLHLIPHILLLPTNKPQH